MYIHIRRENIGQTCRKQDPDTKSQKTRSRRRQRGTERERQGYRERERERNKRSIHQHQYTWSVDETSLVLLHVNVACSHFACVGVGRIMLPSEAITLQCYYCLHFAILTRWPLDALQGPCARRQFHCPEANYVMSDVSVAASIGPQNNFE